MALDLRNTCCFVFRIHQGFFNITYIDTARFFFDHIAIKKIMAGINLFGIVVQAFFSFRASNYGVPKNNYKYYQQYFYSKILYFVTNFLHFILAEIVYCKSGSEESNKDNLCKSTAFGLYIAGMCVWQLLEGYFCLIVHMFYWKTKRGDYGRIGDRPLFLDMANEFEIEQLKTGIILEVRGMKVTGSKLTTSEVEKAHLLEDYLYTSLDHKPESPFKIDVEKDSNDIILKDITILQNKKGGSPTKFKRLFSKVINVITE